MPWSTPRRLAALLAALLAAPAAAAEKGTYWEMTVEMEMKGMPRAMPPTTTKVCQPDGDWTRPPEGKQDPRCKITDLKVTGSTMRWKMACTGEEPMEGEGEMTRTADAFSGKTHVSSRHGDMDMKMRGKKLGGACDPEALRKETEAKVEKYKAQAKASQDQAAAFQVKQCDDAVREMQGMLIIGASASCPDRREAYCARARTEDGYLKLMAQAEMEKGSGGAMPGPKAAAKACALDLAAVQKELCASAARTEHLPFLGAYCPAEAKPIAKRECAGRDYTAMAGSKYRDFCARFMAGQLDTQAAPKAKKGEQKDEEAEAKEKDDSVEKGKKLLKGVLGF